MRAKTSLKIMRIRECAEAGMTRKETADVLGIGYQSVVKRALEFNITFKRQVGEAPNNKRDREICERYLAGEKQADLAREIGLSRERVRQIIERAGLVSETKRHDDYVAVVAGTVARKGFTLSEAVECFGISRMNAWLYCRKHGITPSRMSAGEIAELDALAAQVESGKSIRQAADLNAGKIQKLTRHLIRKGVAARGRSRHDDMTARRKIIERGRAAGLSWGEVAQKIAENDARPIGPQAIYVWAKRHLPHLFDEEAA